MPDLSDFLEFVCSAVSASLCHLFCADAELSDQVSDDSGNCNAGDGYDNAHYVCSESCAHDQGHGVQYYAKECEAVQYTE